jgi:hypothetical protein
MDGFPGAGLPADDPDFELVMPFVACESEGGPYDDDAFVAGVTIGVMLEEFSRSEGPGSFATDPPARYLDRQLVPQADLIAMKYGYKMILGEIDEDSGWQHVTFE